MIRVSKGAPSAPAHQALTDEALRVLIDCAQGELDDHAHIMRPEDRERLARAILGGRAALAKRANG